MIYRAISLGLMAAAVSASYVDYRKQGWKLAKRAEPNSIKTCVIFGDSDLHC
jgi:hypothetical protein